MRLATLQGSEKATVYPTQTTIRNAVDAADWAHAANFNLLLVGVQGKDAWPIAATTWILLPAKGSATPMALDFFRFCLHSSQLADAQGYMPLPPKLIQLIESSWTRSFASAATTAKTAAAAH